MFSIIESISNLFNITQNVTWSVGYENIITFRVLMEAATILFNH